MDELTLIDVIEQTLLYDGPHNADTVAERMLELARF